VSFVDTDPAESPGRGGDYTAIAAELAARFTRGVAAPLEAPVFDGLARRVAGYQFEHCAPYRAYCQARGVRPYAAESWTDVPAVPAAAFKVLDLISHPPGASSAVFRTSGTTAAGTTRGVHHVPDLDLYHGSLLPSFRAHLLPEGGRMPILSLVPSTSAQPDSSLSHMMAVVTERCGAPGSGSFLGPSGALDVGGVVAAATDASKTGTPVLVAGTAFAFVHLIDALDESSTTLTLPEGSRVMETGGFKGRSRELTRSGLYQGIARVLGVTERWIVNEYGMTELLSQFYDGVAGVAAAVEAPGPRSGRVHRPPPWMRTRVVDPVSLEPVAEGQPGLLAHLDLANLGSVSAVLTEDLGVREAGGFRLLGRAPGAEPRGCSIAMDDLLAAVGR
jgi:hypothetical protein